MQGNTPVPLFITARLLGTGAIVAGLWAALGGCTRTDRAGPCESAEILAEYRSYAPRIVSASPGCTRILQWTKHDHGAEREGLIVTNAESGAVLAEMRSANPILRVLWRPDGRAISYFRQEAGTPGRRLFLWELESNVHRELPIPLSYAQQLVRWSPQGRYLAFTNDRGGLVAVDPSTSRSVTIRGEARISAFDWDTEGRRLALAVRSDDETSTVAIADAETGTVLREHPLRRDGELVALAWDGATRVLSMVAPPRPSRDDADEVPSSTSVLIITDPDTGEQSTLRTVAGHNTDLKWLLGGTRYLFQQREIDGTQTIMIADLSSSGEPRRIEREQSLSFHAFSPDGRASLRCRFHQSPINSCESHWTAARRMPSWHAIPGRESPGRAISGCLCPPEAERRFR